MVAAEEILGIWEIGSYSNEKMEFVVRCCCEEDWNEIVLHLIYSISQTTTSSIPPTEAAPEPQNLSEIIRNRLEELYNIFAW
jgi:hypothetical protein